VTAIVAFVFKSKITDKQFNAMEKRFKRVEKTMSYNNLTSKDADAIDNVQNMVRKENTPSLKLNYNAFCSLSAVAGPNRFLKPRQTIPAPAHALATPIIASSLNAPRPARSCSKITSPTVF
jgi:hypothetical protein